VKHCQMVSNCIAITFVGPNPSFYPSSVQGCYLKKGGWTVKTGARSANMVSVDVNVHCSEFQSLLQLFEVR
jgi:hypothetical protein